MHVAVIVVAWNSADDLPECLDAIDRLDHAPSTTIVVDNASVDATPELLAGWVSRSTADGRVRQVLRREVNRGFTGGVNDALGVLDTHVEAVLLVNPDARPAPDLVSRSVARLHQDATIGSVQPLVLRPPGHDGRVAIDTTGHVFTRARLFRNRGEGAGPEDVPAVGDEVFGASGALVLHRRAMLDDVAWCRADGSREVLTEDLVAYFDDVELDWRARLFGWRTVFEPAARGVHERGGAGPRRTAWVEALNASNRVLVVATCDDGRSLLRALPLVACTTLLKCLELAVTTPRAVPMVVRRLRLLPAARRRRAELTARARVSRRAVVDRWAVPFRFGPWIATWWARVGPTGRG